jgi:hypothetical protein
MAQTHYIYYRYALNHENSLCQDSQTTSTLQVNCNGHKISTSSQSCGKDSQPYLPCYSLSRLRGHSLFLRISQAVSCEVISTNRGESFNLFQQRIAAVLLAARRPVYHRKISSETTKRESSRTGRRRVYLQAHWIVGEVPFGGQLLVPSPLKGSHQTPLRLVKRGDLLETL